MSFKASAPGSLMLLGEYAVLHGKHALVCAVDKRIYITLQPRNDSKITIASALGNFTGDLSSFKNEKPFQFVLATLNAYKKLLPSGCDLKIESEFSDKVGFGSSAAVTVATLAALSAWLEKTMSAEELIKEARKIIRRVQGLGSGADIAACVLGGMVAYKIRPFLAEKLPHQYALSAIYSGYKTTTPEAVKQVKAKFTKHTQIYNQLFRAIDACVTQGIDAVRNQDWSTLGSVMNIQQGLMESLGVSTPLLNELIETLRSQSTMLGAKISGSGLGDCVVGLGHAPSLSFQDDSIKQIPVAIASSGVTCEKI